MPAAPAAGRGSGQGPASLRGATCPPPLSSRPHSTAEGLLLKPSCQDSPWVCTFSPLSRIFQGQNRSGGSQRSTRLPAPPANVSEARTHRASMGTSCVRRQDSRDGAGTFQVLPSCPGPRDFSWNSSAKSAVSELGPGVLLSRTCSNSRPCDLRKPWQSPETSDPNPEATSF